MVNAQHQDLGDNSVVVKDGLIVVTLKGHQGAAVAARMLEAFKTEVANMRREGKRVFVLVDYRSLSVDDLTVDARLAIKEAFGQPYVALAAVGKNKLAEIALYLMKAGGAGSRARHFTSSDKAQRWLHDYDTPKVKRSSLLIIAADLAVLVGWLGVVGWLINNRHLMSFIEELRPINPLGALGLMVAGAGLASAWFNYKKTAMAAAIAVIALGVAALLPLNIDYLLFADQARAMGAHVQLADSAAICFIAVGLSMLAIQITSKLARITRGVLAGIVIALAIFNMFGILYAREFMYAISPTFTMALNLSIGLAICGVGLLGILIYDRHGNFLAKVSRTGWLVAVVLLAVQMVTYASWEQATRRNESDAKAQFELRARELDTETQSRVRAYIDALYGMRGLFAASNNGVSELEFNAYYNTLDLSNKYPGIRALSYISRVPENQLAAFTAEQKKSNPAFTIQDKSVADMHYILTYLANLPGVAIAGRDFADDPIRQAAYQQAIQSGQPAVSDTLTFAATEDQPESRGFFITIPLQRSINGGTANSDYVGFVSAAFNYRDFFANAFQSANLLGDIDVRINDTNTGDLLFTSDQVKGDTTELDFGTRIHVADRTWTMNVQAAKDFGNTASQSTLPRAILFGGQAISLLLIAIFWIQNRGRQRALNLADSITADLQHERNEAVATRQKDDAILSSIGDAVFAVDTDERITLFNPAAQIVSGFTEAEAVGEPYRNILRFEFGGTGGVNASFIKKALTGTLASMENHTVIVRKDGVRVPVADSAAPIRDLTGKIVGAIIVFRDVTTEYELDRAKTEFVSLASHQLRTPLSAINWYAEMLLNGDAGQISEDQRTYLSEIYEGNQRMVELVNSLLDVSRLDLGKLTNEPSPIHMKELIADLEKEMATSVNEKKIAVANEVETNLPPVLADPKLLRMIVQNLVSNAIKYTVAGGSVMVTARTATTDDVQAAGLKTDPYMLFSVADTGYGIPDSQQNKIFTKLFRADNVRALDVEGTGLGLYIVKEVTEKLGGKVWFESVEGKGSTFYVILPFTTKTAK